LSSKGRRARKQKTAQKTLVRLPPGSRPQLARTPPSAGCPRAPPARLPARSHAAAPWQPPPARAASPSRPPAQPPGQPAPRSVPDPPAPPPARAVCALPQLDQPPSIRSQLPPARRLQLNSSGQPPAQIRPHAPSSAPERLSARPIRTRPPAPPPSSRLPARSAPSAQPPPPSSSAAAASERRRPLGLIVLDFLDFSV
jgi:hypothetical protein